MGKLFAKWFSGMEAWWRLIRGVKPYRWMVVLSMICALGVGLSYASGVAVMLPVMKVFMSMEGLTGWTNRSAAESRVGVELFDLHTSALSSQFGSRVELRVSGIGKEAPIEIRDDAPEPIRPNFQQDVAKGDVRLFITKVGDAGEPEQAWLTIVQTLAHAPSDKPITMHFTATWPDPAAPLDPTKHISKQIVLQKTLPPGSFHTRALVWANDFLPVDDTATNKIIALAKIVGFFIFLCIIGSIFRYYQQFLGMVVANRVIMDLRRRTYDRIVQLPTSHFAQKGTTDMMARLSHDAGTLTEGVAMAFGKAVQEPIKALGAFTFALIIDWKLTAMIIVTVPILAIIIRKFSKHMRKASRKAMENSSAMLAIVNETLIGARVVKAYSAEGYERRRYALANKKLLKQQIKLNHYNALSRPTVETLAVIASTIPMLLAANWVFQHPDAKEGFITLLALFGAMMEPMRKLADVNAKMQQTNAAATRVFEIADMKPEPNLSHALPKLPRHQRSIEFRDINFNYPGHEEKVLKHVSFTVKAGQNVAIVGGNGSGKTTLLSLLPRLYIPTTGQVIIDGVDAGTVSLRSLRKQIGLVTQDTLLFADTIYNNIAYGTRHATPEQVMDAARKAYVDEFVKNLTDGYETRVGEMGMRLSGGQKQRIAIARAILHDPTILILDEAMSQIDADSEQKITDALRAFTRGRTTFMIAHRFQSVISADLIVCLDRGEIAGIGTHNQLYESCPPYRKLCETQFGRPSEAV